MNELMEYLPFVIPLAIIELGLMVGALIHILTHRTYARGNRVLWILLSVCVMTIGPLLYFILGRDDGGKD